MRYLLVKFFYFLIILLDKFFSIFSKKFLLRGYIYQELRETLKFMNIDKYKFKMFIHSNLVEWRCNNVEEKEPETIEWIKKFNSSNNKINFWDIWANIGLYTLFASKYHENKIQVIAFEPSVLNLSVLARNIYENKLNNTVKILQLPLTDNQGKFLQMKETFLEEGASLSTFGEDYNFEGKKINPKITYNILGISIDSLINQKILEIPNYIKIDVDGIEHLILESGLSVLRSNSLLSVLVEINENFEDQKKRVEKLMSSCGFKLFEKHQSKNLGKIKELNNTYNYIYNK